MSGHQVKHAASLAETGPLLAEPLDTVIVDWNLPDARGDEVLRAVLASQPNVRVLVTSGGGVSLPADLQDQVAQVLRKPFGLRVLRSAITP